MECPKKRVKLLSDDEDSPNGGSDAGSFPATEENGLRIDEEYARRFEHNKKREERQRLEEKYKSSWRSREAESESDSTSEDEDDVGELVTGDLDHEIEKTLQALKTKDPRIYDKSANFYRPIEESDSKLQASPVSKQKPLYLKDYHRQNLLNGVTDTHEDENGEIPRSYDQEQDDLRRSLVAEMHAAAGANSESDEDAFLRKKSKPVHDKITMDKADVNDGVHPSRQSKLKVEGLDIENADKDPETYLSNFMAARAWVPDAHSRFAPLDSDDSEEEKRAEEFEDAYNMRFEDPDKANAKLTSYARDMEKFSVRREEKTGRKKAREREKEAKEAAKRERREEKARLRKLRIEEIEERVKMVREAAGLAPTEVVNLDEWREVLEGDFDDDLWEREMQKRFGDKYYAEKEELDCEEPANSKSRLKKPKWDDDIDIKDLVPDFDNDVAGRAAFTLTDDEEDANGTGSENDARTAKPHKGKSRKEQSMEKKRADRKQRAQIESLVDDQMNIEAPETKPAGFRYRETSPVNYGLSTRDILFADDAQLNTFAGIKKTHAFRDEAKKAKDRKKLGKKARLREWRRETFGDEAGYSGTFAEYVEKKLAQGQAQEKGLVGRKPRESLAEAPKHANGNSAKIEPTSKSSDGFVDGERKKKRKRKHKTSAEM